MLLTGTPAEQCEALRKQVSGCASWFFWIAALTLINSAMIHSGSETSFLIGLTVSMAADGITADMGAAAKTIAVAFDAMCIGALVFLGCKARRGARWAFVLGLVLYGMDTFLSLVAPNLISIALHGWALFSMGVGLRLAGKLEAAEVECALPPILGGPSLPPPLTGDAQRVDQAATERMQERKQASATSAV